MARYDMGMVDGADMGAAASGDVLVRLGLMYSCGRSVPADKIAAHKWFNLAAVKGNREAVALRRELAAEMAEWEIAAAQRAAREWLSIH